MSVIVPFCLLFSVTSPTYFYTLSLHDALPIYTAFVKLKLIDHRHLSFEEECAIEDEFPAVCGPSPVSYAGNSSRSEEHTSELQSRQYLVCRLLLEKKNCSRYTRLPCVPATRSA